MISIDIGSFGFSSPSGDQIIEMALYTGMALIINPVNSYLCGFINEDTK